MSNYQALVDDRFAEPQDFGAAAGSESLTGILAIAERIGRDLIRVDAANVDKIADAVGVALTKALLAFDIPYLPEFVEVKVEAYLVAVVVTQLKKFGHNIVNPA